MRTYFYSTLELDTGEWVELVYESSHRKGTQPHDWDLVDAIIRSGITPKHRSPIKVDTSLNAYILNNKNKDEQAFGEYHRVIDLR